MNFINSLWGTIVSFDKIQWLILKKIIGKPMRMKDESEYWPISARYLKVRCFGVVYWPTSLIFRASYALRLCFFHSQSTPYIAMNLTVIKLTFMGNERLYLDFLSFSGEREELELFRVSGGLPVVPRTARRRLRAGRGKNRRFMRIARWTFR